MGTLFVIFSACISVSMCHRITLQSPQVTYWGNWYHIDRCPQGMYATGLQIKYQPNQGSGDNTCLNGIALYCNRLDKPFNSNNYIMSKDGDKGAWDSAQWCPNGLAVIGFNLRSYPHRANNDDVAAVNFAVACGSPFGHQNVFNWLQGNTDNWGEWTAQQFCPQGYAACGIQTQVYFGTVYEDNTGMDNVRVECCQIGDISDIPGFELVTVANFDNSFGAKMTIVTYKVKTSFTNNQAKPSKEEGDIFLNKIYASAPLLTNGINAQISTKSDYITTSNLMDLVKDAVSHNSERTFSVQISPRQRATIKQLHITIGTYKVGVAKTVEEGIHRPKPNNSEEHGDSHDHDEDDDDDC